MLDYDNTGIGGVVTRYTMSHRIGNACGRAEAKRTRHRKCGVAVPWYEVPSRDSGVSRRRSDQGKFGKHFALDVAHTH